NNLCKKLALPEEIVVYFPLDLSFIVRKVLKKIKPSLVIILETELWPNFISQCFKQKIPVILVNARISEQAYRRYRWVKFLLEPVLNKITLILAQSQKDREKFVNLGGDREKILVTGNMKFDTLAYIDKKYIDYASLKLKLGLKDRERLLVAGSTHKGEEKIIVTTYKELILSYPDLRLLIAPRHPQRTAEIERLIIKAGFNPIRVSCLEYHSGEPRLPIFILDTIGQLNDFYALAEIVFVGGSLVKRGGHNILEPATFSKPIVSGKYFFNFSDIFKIFLENRAILICRDKAGLKQFLLDLLDNSELRKNMGMLAKGLILRHKGAVERNLSLLAKYLDS
ncbi:MAG: 3-deoxy-D-manno-octulosonic acid transferase, partial [Candidatus Omnitrophica bacterium]|nr:3-deoxy-D-manno-octulosonic acid transferase [Candidatus Omnitrophota bacterium]